MSLVFYSGFNSNDFSEWGTPPTGTTHQTAAAAAMNGTAYGDEVDLGNGGTTPDNLVPTFSDTNGVLRLGFFLDTNDLAVTTPGAGEEAEVIELLSDGYLSAVTVQLSDTGSGLFVIVTTHDDAGNPFSFNSSVLSAGAHVIEIEVNQAATAISEDGNLETYIDYSLVSTISSLDNFELFGNISGASITLGVTDFPSGHSGTFYLDEISLRDDGTTIYPQLAGYDFIMSSGGLARHAIAPSSDGAYVFVALEENTSGDQYVFSVTRPVTGSAPTVAPVYEPAGGSAAGVATVPGNPDKMLFFGNFGTDIGVIMHTISTGANTDISPSSIGTDVIIWAAVDPSDADHIVAINDTDSDLLETTDGGTTWTTLDASLPVTSVTGAFWLWSGAYFTDRGFIGGGDGVDEHLAYTPNEASGWREDTGANGLKSSDGIVGIDAVVS